MAELVIETEWDDLDKAFEEIEAELSQVVRGLSIEAWNYVLQQTPQFYGRLAASWTYSLNAPVFVDRSKAAMMSVSTLANFTTDPDEGDVFTGRRKGDPEAIGIANLASIGHETRFKLGDTIFFSNGADHGEGPYAADVESGAVYLRPVNRPGRMASRAFDRMQSKYGNDVSPQRVEYLKSLRIA